MKGKSNMFENRLKTQQSKISYEDNDYLLDQMYSRVRYKIKQEATEPTKHTSTHSNSILQPNMPNKVETKSQYAIKKQSSAFYSHSTNKNSKIEKKDQKKIYFKTDMNTDQDDYSLSIHLENQKMKNQLRKCKTKIVQLQSYQQQTQYLKKLCLLQNIEIQKLRNMLKNSKMDNIRQKKSKQYVSNYGQSKSDIDVQKKQNMPSSLAKRQKRQKCSHKNQISKQKSINENRVKYEIKNEKQKRLCSINVRL